MEEKTLETLQQEFENKLQEIRNLSTGLNRVERFSHHAKSVVTTFSLIGITGAIREASEKKKLQKFLDTKIYNGMDYESVARHIGKLSNQLVEMQLQIQQRYGDNNNIPKMVQALDDCYNAWYGISPAVADEELRTPSGDTDTLSNMARYVIRKPFNSLELPKQFEYMKV